jgi:hypothetical protein
MTESEATEFAKDKLLTHLTTFTGLDVRKIFDSQRSTALRSNLDFYSFDGAVRTVTKIEHFIKPQDMQYKIPAELYRELTSDSSLHNTVMLQAIQLSHISEASPSADVSPVQKPIHATDYQSRSASQPQGAKSPTFPYKNCAV